MMMIKVSLIQLKMETSVKYISLGSTDIVMKYNFLKSRDCYRFLNKLLIIIIKEKKEKKKI